MPEPRREIVREHEFEEQLERLIPGLEEADDFLASAEDLLSYAPTSGRLISSEFNMWALPMFPVREKTVVYITGLMNQR